MNKHLLVLGILRRITSYNSGCVNTMLGVKLAVVYLVLVVLWAGIFWYAEGLCGRLLPIVSFGVLFAWCPVLFGCRVLRLYRP